MTTTRTEIFNQACLYLHISPDIDEANEDTHKAKTFRAVYDFCRRETLRRYHWNFARRFIDLAQVGTAPASWSHQYAYPDDCIRPVQIVPSDRRQKPIPYKVGSYAKEDGSRARCIWTDQSDASLEYTGNEDTVGMFDELFALALAAYMAYRTSATFSASKDVVAECREGFIIAMSDASMADGAEHVPDAPRDSDWIAARNGATDTWEQ